MGAVAGSFSLNKSQFKRLTDIEPDWEKYRIYKSLEKAVYERWYAYLDKAFEPLNFCLQNDAISQSVGPAVKLCLFGGKQIFSESGAYVVCGEELIEASRSLEKVNEELFTTVLKSYEGRHSLPDYVWRYFEVLRDLYRRSIAANRAAIIFSTEYFWIDEPGK